METKKEIERIERKAVKDRTQEEHLFLVKNKYKGTREYLLSMGLFKDELQIIVEEKLKQIKKKKK